MKNTKRLLSLLLAVAMLVSCFAITAVFADEETTDAVGEAIAEEAVKLTGTALTPSESEKTKFTDVFKSDEYSKAVETLNLMGVINGYPDGSFGPANNVTRAEFTAMLMRLLNYGSLGSTSAAELPFTDIKDDDSDISWAIPNINTAYGMGVINGYEDGTFRPNDNVAYEEAVKMVVCSLGYTGIDVTCTPWYSNYVAQASKLGITSNLSNLGRLETPASRACIAQMLYDSLEAKMVVNDVVSDKTILTDYLGYKKSVGVVTSDGVTSLSSPDVRLNPGEVQIKALEPSTNTKETHTYKTTDDSLKNYLGYEIEFYYKDNGETRTMALYVLNPTNTLTLANKDIDEEVCTDTQIYYTKEGTKTRLSAGLAKDNVVIFNNKLYGSNENLSRFSTDMLPRVGKVTLIDSNNDNVYDIVKIESYEIYYVSSKVASEYSIVDDVTRDGADKVLILDVNSGTIDTVIVNKSGNNMDYSSIGVGNIVCLEKSREENGGTVMQKAVVVSDTVTGTITAVSQNDTVTINGNEYQFSEGAPWMWGGSGLLEQPKLEDSGTYNLDLNGDIVAYKKNAVVENISYGYLMNIVDKKKSSFDSVKMARILDQNGKVVTVNIDENTRLNGEKYSNADEIVEELEEYASFQNTDPDATNVTVQQIIKYTTRVTGGDLTINKLYASDYPYEAGSEVKSDEVHYYAPVSGIGSINMNYSSNSKQLTGGGISVNVGSAVVFVVPSDRSATNDYELKSVSAVFRNSATAGSTTYNAEFYDVSKANTAKVVVCYGQDSSTTVNDYTGFSVLSEPIEVRRNESEDTNMAYLTGYTSMYNKPKDTLDNWLSDDAEFTPQLGDIFRAGTDKNGYIKTYDDYLMFSMDGGNNWGKYSSQKDESKFYSAVYSMVLGSVTAVDEESVAVLPEYLTKDDYYDETEIADSSMNFALSSFSGARVLKYDNTGKTLKINDMGTDYEGALKGMAPYSYEAVNPTKVLIYMYEGAVKLVCILGEDVAE